MCFFSPKKLAVYQSLQKSPIDVRFLGTYCIGWFCWGRVLTDWWVKGASSKFVEMMKRSLRYI